MDGNLVHGPLPSYMAGWTQLRQLSLADSYYTGPIPLDLHTLFNVSVINLSNNKLDGTLPATLELMQQINYLMDTGGFKASVLVNAVVGYPASIAWWTKGNQPNMRDINSAQEFVEATKNAGDKLVLVYFYSVGCRSCKALHPKICQIAEDNPDIEVLKINFHENNALCRCLKVSMLPFLHFYRGKEGRIDAFSRSLTKIAKLRAAVAKHKGGSQSALPTPGPVVAVADQKDLKPLPTSSLATASSIL